MAFTNYLIQSLGTGFSLLVFIINVELGKGMGSDLSLGRDFDLLDLILFR